MQRGDSLTQANLPLRIKNIYNSCTPEEQLVLIQILEELATYGYSETYNNVWLEDFKEIPVDLETFLTDDYYLGKVTRQGDAIYPYWKDVMHEIVDAGNQYQEIVFTGATRIGKSSTAITLAAYYTYWLMCLRDPQKFFNKKDESKFSILFFNLTLDLAKGIAFREYNDTLKASPWFCEHGSFSKSVRDFYYVPEGGKVVISYGSDAAHALGQQVFCFTGDTKIRVPGGWSYLSELNDMHGPVYQYGDGQVFEGMGTVLQTSYANELVQLVFEDGTEVKCTRDHKLLSKSKGKEVWKTAFELSAGDEIVAFDDTGTTTSTVISKDLIYLDQPVPVYDVIEVQPYHTFLLYGNQKDLVVSNCAIMDEVNFSRSGVKDVNKAKEHMKNLYDTIVARVQGTFRLNGQVYGKVFSVSSKRGDSDFMEQHVQDQLAAGNTHLYVSDKPQWEVLPPSMFSPGRFHIAVGDRHHRGFVVDNESPEALAELKEQGYNLLEVPIDMKTNFLADFDISLRDLAGISVPGALSFITQDAISACIGDRHNPFFNDILEIGTKDSYTIEEFFHMEVVDKSLLRHPMYIHLDLSLNTDATGISGNAVTGNKVVRGEDGKSVAQPFFTHVFSIKLRAPRGDKIPYAKITEFICWLRRQGFNIEGISRDQFQSEYMAQLLEAQGFDVDKVSLDRTPDGYMALRSILLEQRIDMLDVQELQDELIYLQRDAVTGKIDHRVGFEKDLSDSFAGSIWNAILHQASPGVSAKSVANAISAVNRPRGVAADAMNLPSMFPGLYKNNKKSGWR